MTTAEPIQILKRDALGRVTVSRAQREALLDEFERSGLKGLPFSRLVGVNYQTLASRIQKRRHERGVYPCLQEHSAATPQASRSAKRPLRLMEAVLASTAEAAPAACAASLESGLEILLPGGAKAVIANARQVALAAQLIDSLQSPC